MTGLKFNMPKIWPMLPLWLKGKQDNMDNIDRFMDIQDIKKMPVTKRMQLVQDIWDSLESETREVGGPIKKELDSGPEGSKKKRAKRLGAEKRK